MGFTRPAKQPGSAPLVNANGMPRSHPPSPSGWVPPLPQCRRGLCNGAPPSPTPAMRERVPSAARRVRGLQLVRPESEQFRGVVGGDLAPVLLGDAGEDAVEKILRLR